MSDTITAPSEQPAPDIAPVQTPGEQPAVIDHSATLQSLDQAQLGDLLWNEKKEPATETVQAPAAVTAPPAETPPAETDGEQPSGEAGVKSDLRRLALGGVPLSERQQMAEVARMIRVGEASTQVEALQKMGLLGTPATPPVETETPPASETPPSTTPPASTVSELETTIADLRAQRTAAKRDYDQEEEDRLDALISQHERQLIRAELIAETQQVAQRTWQDEHLTAIDAMEAKHAWATDDTSPLYEALNDKVTAAQFRNDPALQDPNYINVFADQIAERFGKPAPVAKPPPPPTQAPRIVGGGVAPGHSEAHAPTPHEASELIRNATPEQLAAALFAS